MERRVKEVGVLVAARVSPDERDALHRVASANDRTPSREIRRAIRYYVEHFDAIDRALRKQQGVLR